MLDMILSNDPKGHSLGEVIALFRPFKNHYEEERQKILNDKSGVWYHILTGGPDKLYPLLFEHFNKEVDFFVDSSKNPFWIARQTNILKKMGVSVENVLIYKDKYDLASSYKKRNRYEDWEKSYIGYHARYTKLIEDFFAISYKDVVQNPASIEMVCKEIGISYFEKKEEFWNKREVTSFFGNDRTRYHNLQAKENIPKSADTTRIDSSNDYQKIYYYPCKDSQVIMDVDRRVTKNFSIEKIERFLDDLNMRMRKDVDVPNNLLFEQAKKYSIGKARFFIENYLYTFFGPKLFHHYERYVRNKRLAQGE